MAALTPSRFGKYELLARLARGGMAETFLAQLKGAAGVTKQVVIKRVLPHLSQDEAFITAFINEAKLSASLSHGNIAQVFDFGRVDGDYFIAMELVDGRSLAQLLERAATMGFAKLPIPIACFLAMEVLKGLHYAHTRLGEGGQPLSLVHRDVSPENVLVSFEGQTKVVDFGVAKAALRGRTETEPGLVKGKFLFFSPEQACAEPLDGRSDVFAVGVVLYRMLCGVLPFEGQMHNVMRAIVAGRFRPAAVVNPQLPSALAAVLGKAMVVDRSQRYATALEMQEAIASFLYRQEPTFSGETVKEWMIWLFGPELEAEGRSVSLSSRFQKQLQKWDPQTGATAPSVQAVTREHRTRVGRPSRVAVAWVAGAIALIAAGIGVGLLSGSEPDRAAPSVEATQLKNPFPDDLIFPGTGTVVGSRHRLRLELVSLPAMAGEPTGHLEEPNPPGGHSPMFAIGRSNKAAHDGQVVLVLRVGDGPEPSFTSMKLFDFQPFLESFSGDMRKVRFGESGAPQSFSDSAAQIDARAGTWLKVRGVGGTVKLTLTAREPRVWAARPRPASVVVAWQRAPGFRAIDSSRWPGGADRAVLAEGTPLIVEGASSFAIAFADSFASTAADSVDVKIEAATSSELAAKAAPDNDNKITAAHVEIQALRWSRAEAILESCRVGDTQCPEATALLAQMNQERGLRNALADAEAALDQGKLGKAQSDLAIAHSTKLLTRRYDEALARFRAATDSESTAVAPRRVEQPRPPRPVEPANPSAALFDDAKRLFREKQYPAAKIALQKCIKIDPRNADCHKVLGTVWAKLNEVEKGAQEYREFLRLASPDHPDVDKVKSILQAFEAAK